MGKKVDSLFDISGFYPQCQLLERRVEKANQREDWNRVRVMACTSRLGALGIKMMKLECSIWPLAKWRLERVKKKIEKMARVWEEYDNDYSHSAKIAKLWRNKLAECKFGKK